MINTVGLHMETIEDGHVSVTKTCMFCNQKVDLGHYDKNQILQLKKVLTYGNFSTLKWMRPEYREMFISGMCPECWKKAF